MKTNSNCRLSKNGTKLSWSGECYRFHNFVCMCCHDLYAPFQSKLK